MNVAALEEAEDRRKQALLRELGRLHLVDDSDSEVSTDPMNLREAAELRRTCGMLEQKIEQIASQQEQFQERLRSNAAPHKNVSFEGLKSPEQILSPVLSCYSTQAALPVDPVLKPSLSTCSVSDIQTLKPLLVTLCNELEVTMPHNVVSNKCVADVLSRCIDGVRELKDHCKGLSRARISPPRKRLPVSSDIDMQTVQEQHQHHHHHYEPEIPEGITQRKEILRTRIRELLHKREITENSISQQIEALQRSQGWWAEQKAKHIEETSGPLPDFSIYDNDVRESTMQCELITSQIQGFLTTIDEGISAAQSELQQLEELEMSAQYVHGRREPSV
eukprot:TRINITY_DN30926_c0_g1_i1.p1 TRINITY_DN30926_c0_g1~~TRINITY_DN30926_c0_g1_i1.p1  ORF type:complete len:334 (+),score=73.98 TRINITY_DN30926_c0_g1_i1:47-1048(+)